MIKAAIKNVMKEKGKDGMSKSKLKKCVIEAIAAGSDQPVGDLKCEFNDALDKLVEKGKLVIDGKFLTLAGKDSTGNKRKLDDAENDAVAETTDSKKLRVKDNISPKAAEMVSNDDPDEALKRPNVSELWRTGEQMWKEGGFDSTYLQTNPDRITRVFCGNLNKDITEEQLKSCVDGVTHIKWITDKQTRQFYGSTFLELRDPRAAAEAVKKDRQKFMGRPLKIYYCPPRPGDVWPPVGGSAKQGGGRPERTRKEKPEGSRKLFIGNLSYNIDDDTICEFFKDCGELVGLRWLTHQGTEEFRGCGFVEFASTEMADEAIKLDGKELLGRPIRIDWD